MILCCGEALIDMIPTATTDGQTGFVPLNGGAIFNTAIALGRLGAPTGMVTGLSSDLFGQQLLAGLKQSNVNTARIAISDRTSTLAFVQLVEGHATYTFYDENSAGRGLAISDLPSQSDDITALYFGGISLCNPPAADTYQAFAEREAGRAVIMLDPNIRPGFILDDTAHRARLAAMIAASDIIKVSDEDLDWIYPSASLSEQITRLQEDGALYIILTRGSEGATAFGPNNLEVTIKARKVKVVDTVGAGDTFNAGFLASLSNQGLLTRDAIGTLSCKQLQAAMSLGAQVAAITVSRAGANSPWKSELTQ